MTTSAHRQTIVQGLVSARRSGQAWSHGSVTTELGVDDAYAIQSGVASAMGWFPDGPKAWKVGGHPLTTAAPLPEVLDSPARWACSSPNGVLIEAELAFRLSDTPARPEDVLACIGTVCVSIELIGTRLIDGLGAPAHWKLADQGVHAGLLAGSETPYAVCAHFSDADWRQQRCRVLVNGRLEQQGQGTHPSVNPLTALPWLVAHAAQHTGGLKAGDLITTGAWAMLTVVSGDVVEVVFDGLGSSRLTLT